MYALETANQWVSFTMPQTICAWAVTQLALHALGLKMSSVLNAMKDLFKLISIHVIPNASPKILISSTKLFASVSFQFIYY